MKYKSLNLSLIALFGFFIGISFFSQNAYAAYSASISRTSSGTVTLSDGSGGSIKPSSAGTLGTGSDIVTVSSNCSAGYNLYVSAISGGSTNLTTSGGLDYIPSTTTATGSEAALTKDTWGIGKDGTTFSKLQSYSEDLSTMSPLYTGTGSISSPNKEYTIYYGVNVSTAKTPGTYTGDVLYTVLMNSACEKFTLSYNGNSATTNKLSSEELAFDATIDLSIISSTDKIAKTGYHLSGWQDQDGNSYGVTGEVDINPNDLTTVTLTAIWTANTYTIKYAAGSTGGTCNVSDTPATYDQDVTLSSTKCTKTNYDQKGWSINPSGTPKSYDLGKTLIKPNFSSTNGGSITLYPYFVDITTMQGWAANGECAKLSVNSTVTLKDSRDQNSYVIKKLKDNKCWMVQSLRLTNYKLTPVDSDVSADFDLTTATGNIKYSGSSGWCKTYTEACHNVKAVYYNSSEASNSGKSSYYGALYNWYTATASTGTHAMSSGDATSSICPKGWHLPKGGTDKTTNEFSILDVAYGGTGADRTKANTYSTFTGAYTSGDNSGFGPTGRITGSVDLVGSNGYYWSSTASSSDAAYFLFLRKSDTRVNSAGTGDKHVGISVRCIVN